ncbi:MAG: transposase [Acidobacteriota bacterium]
MTRRKNSAKAAERKSKEPAGIAGQQEDLLPVLIRRALEELMEAERDEAVGAEGGQRTPNRTGYRSGSYRRTLVVRSFPNAASCLRLIRALAVETHEDRIEAARYLGMDLLREQEKSWPRLGETA